MAQKKKPEDKSGEGLDRRWHLANTPFEIEVTEAEYSLMRAYEGFGRWQQECLGSVIEHQLSGPENALLHIIRMHDRPKSIKDLAWMTNRDDIPNIQYSLRKLIKAGLVRRSGSGRAGVTYSASERGVEVTDHYAKVRKTLLVQALSNVPDFDTRLSEAARTFELLTGIYEQVARIAATHRRVKRD